MKTYFVLVSLFVFQIASINASVGGKNEKNEDPSISVEGLMNEDQVQELLEDEQVKKWADENKLEAEDENFENEFSNDDDRINEFKILNNALDQLVNQNIAGELNENLKIAVKGLPEDNYMKFLLTNYIEMLQDKLQDTPNGAVNKPIMKETTVY